MAQDPEAIMKQFKHYDQSGDGVIDQKELENVLTSLDSHHWTGDRVARLFEAIDVDNDGTIEVEEFVEWICGANMKSAHIFSEKPLTVFRMDGFSEWKCSEIKEVLEKFGKISMIHHVPGYTNRTLVLFVDEDDAVKAFEAHGGVIDETVLEQDGEFKTTVSPGQPLYDKSQVKTIFFTPKSPQISDNNQNVPAEFGNAFMTMVESFKTNLGENYKQWRSKSRSMTNVSNREGAKQLRLLSMLVKPRDESHEDAIMWRKTMRSVAKGEFSLRDSSTMMDFIRQWESFVDAGVAPVEAAPVKKRNKNMTSDDPWGHVSGLKSRDNSAMNLAFR